MRKLLTEDMIRSNRQILTEKHCVLDPGTIITPAAMDLIRENGIEISYSLPSGPAASTGAGGMHVSPLPEEGGRRFYLDHETGQRLYEKPEEMTHLRGNRLVNKTHPQIAFRGRLDSLTARILLAQQEAEAVGADGVLKDLDDVLAEVRSVLRAEVLDEALPAMDIMGMDQGRIRYVSHHIKDEFGIDHPIPDRHMGRLALRLNELRTLVRETELSAAEAFCSRGGRCCRPDILEAMNRLSSCIYIILCRHLSGWYNTAGTEETGAKGQTGTFGSCMVPAPGQEVPVEISARHVHVTREALDALYGKGYELTPKRYLSQPGQFLSEEKVELVTSKGRMKVSILGPLRSALQTEVSLTDARTLGLEVPVRLSGDLAGAADITLVGPAGSYEARSSVIAAKAHVHMTPEDAARYGVKDGETVAVKLMTARPVTLEDVAVRVTDSSALAVHIDFDEANAAAASGTFTGLLFKKEAPAIPAEALREAIRQAAEQVLSKSAAKQ